MKERRCSFSYFDMIFIIIITFLSFEVRNFRLARPQSPIYCEEFEICFYKNYINSDIMNGEEKSLSRIIKYFYIHFAQIDINDNFLIHSNKTKEYQYGTYRYVSLRQYSTYFSMLCPSLLYIYLIFMNVNPYIAKIASFILVFNEIITTESRAFSSSGFYQFSFLLSLISLNLFSSYDKTSIYYYFSLIFSSFFMLLSFNLHERKSFLLLIFYLIYFYFKKKRFTNNNYSFSQYSLEMFILIIPLILSIYYSTICEKLFLKANKFQKLTKTTMYEEYLYPKNDYSSCFLLIFTLCILLYAFLNWKNILEDFYAFLFLFIALFSFPSLLGSFSLFTENSLEIINSLIICSKILTKTKLYYKKYVSFAITLFLIITVLIFINHAPYVYIYDREHPEQ